MRGQQSAKGIDKGCGPAMSRPLGALLLITAIFSCTVLPAEEYDPFLVPREHADSLFEAVAVTPVVAPHDIFFSNAASARIDSVIAAFLVTAGIRIVPAEEYSNIWSDIVKQVGGFFDPLTGDRIEHKFATARRELLRELLARFGTNTVMYVELEVVEAYVDRGVADWDGVTQSIVGASGGIVSSFRHTFEQDEFGASRDGTVGALSLVVAVDGGDGSEIYKNFGGLEVLWSVSSPDSAPQLVVQANIERTVRAVERSLGPLARLADPTR